MKGENRCVMCNEIIPEGRQVCPMCEGKFVVKGIDLVEVVRCKDCTWFDRDDDTGTECPVIESGGYPHWNGYCWLGERKEDEAD